MHRTRGLLTPGLPMPDLLTRGHALVSGSPVRTTARGAATTWSAGRITRAWSARTASAWASRARAWANAVRAPIARTLRPGPIASPTRGAPAPSSSP